MTTLSENLKTIRKSLRCTQMAISKVLDIGFRTYVRYEAGERDAPVSVLVKFAKLGNLSLDRLLTTQITPEELKIPDVETLPSAPARLEAIGGSLEEGRLVFKGLKGDFLVSSCPNEKSLIGLFRRMDRTTREKVILDAEWTLKNSLQGRNKAAKKKLPKKAMKAKNAAKLKQLVKSIKKITLKG
ncbi:MAG: helix-turn-helix transcriptional regulator [Nitrospinae bacterium]|nr:helix-turn-helix transcriptional regulator [Nitrospinota bacterium]